jgi:metal-dependent amidase/aminoacylase/carboxypeptidase family protein
MTASGLSPATGAADLEQVYRDLHANPELSLQEHRTAALAGDHLAAAGFDITTNTGATTSPLIRKTHDARADLPSHHSERMKPAVLLGRMTIFSTSWADMKRRLGRD